MATCEEASKRFFFEKKNQKTFVFGRKLKAAVSAVRDSGYKSFLLLFSRNRRPCFRLLP